MHTRMMEIAATFRKCYRQFTFVACSYFTGICRNLEIFQFLIDSYTLIKQLKRQSGILYDVTAYYGTLMLMTNLSRMQIVWS